MTGQVSDGNGPDGVSAGGGGVDDPRCGQPTTTGRPCRNRPVQDGMCRLHAHRSTAQDSADAPAGRDQRTSRRGRRPSATSGHVFTPSVPPPGEGIDLLVALSRVLGDGLGPHLDRVGALLRRRFTGDYEVDDFGLDADLLVNVLRPLAQPLYDHWWRVTSHGREHLPAGGGLVVANHAGTLPADGLMLNLDLHDATGRHVRELGADLVFTLPFIGHLARKSGVVRAGTADADALLGRDELVAVFPEGYKGLGKPFAERYRLERFGRGGFVAAALRARVPIIPTAIVGSEEIYPLLWDAKAIASALRLPYFPVVAQMLALPIVGPIGLLPLPSKWSITYGEPLDTSGLPDTAVDDPMTVFDLADRVRDIIQDMLTRIVMGRQSVFF